MNHGSIPVVQIGKLRLRDMQRLAQSHSPERGRARRIVPARAPSASCEPALGRALETQVTETRSLLSLTALLGGSQREAQDATQTEETPFPLRPAKAIGLQDRGPCPPAEPLDSSLGSDTAHYGPSSRAPRNPLPSSGSCAALQTPCLVLRPPLPASPVGHRWEQAV